MSLYESETEIANLVRALEACEIGKDDFKHRDHLAVAVWYLETSGREAAVDRMRSSLLRFLSHHGVDRKQYNETITIFWIEMLSKKLNELGPEVPLVDKCNQAIESMTTGVVLDYYSPELLWSDEARATFVAPDLKALAG